MRILFQYYSGGGGALENIKILLSGIIKSSPLDDFFIVCERNSTLTELSVFDNVEIINPIFFFHKEITRLYLGVYGLNRLVEKFDVDILWSMNLGPYRRVNCINILSLNNSHQVYPIKYTKSHPSSRLHVLLLRFFFRLSLKNVDKVITQTDIISDYVKKIRSNVDISVITKVVENNDDIKVTEIPIDVKNKINLVTGNLKLIYIATDMEHKNHATIINSMAVLSESIVNISLVLSLSEEQAVERFGDIAKKLIRNGNLICIGWVEKAWLEKLYGLIDICVMPSILESLSSSYLEAMAWKKPQIVSDLPFSHDTCKNAALYCNPYCSKDWTEKITHLANNKKLQDKLIDNGLNRMSEFPFDWKEVSEKYNLLFTNEIIKRGGNVQK